MTMHGYETARPRSESPPSELSVAHRARFVYARWCCRAGPLGRQMTRLGRWLEDEVFPEEDRLGRESLCLTVEPEGRVRIERPGERNPPVLEDCPDLCALLDRLGIRGLKVDTRLESNQIEDILILLYAYRRDLSPGGSTPGKRKAVKRMYDDEGLHFNCMQIRRTDESLVVRYSYCTTRLSLAVRWYERRHRHFSDHRALFQAAPRYGALAAGLAILVLVGFLMTDSLVFLVTGTLVEAAILFTAVYVFMRGMGSVEYDNEESAYRLSRAHAKLSQYADRIQNDLAMARRIQQSLLPDLDRMPLRDRLEWVSSFAPEIEVGGDYFDAAPLDDRRAAIVFSDVSGHGMAASLITVIVKMAFAAWVECGWPVRDFVMRLNDDLCRFTPDGSFVVLVAAIYDAASNRLNFVNCGHGPPPLYVPADGSRPVACLDEPSSMLLGIEKEIEIFEANRDLAGGDTIVLATDGLTEAANLHGELYGVERLIEHIESTREASPGAMVDSLVNDVARFSERVPRSDDRTVLAFRVQP